MHKLNKLKNFIKLSQTSIFIVLFYIILSFRFFNFIINNTENILVGDQWDIVNEVTQNNNIFSLFLHQHNEHRIGVGLLIIKALAFLTHWNNLAEAIFTGMLIFISSILALLLKKRILKKLEIFDILIPILFLNLYQWQNITWGFQISFTLPLFFLMLSLYLYSLRRAFANNLSLIIIALLSTYSSFHGIFVALLTGGYFLINFIIKKSNKFEFKSLIYAIVSLAICISYFINYQQAPFLGSKQFHIKSFIKYIFLQINGFMGHFNYNILYFIVPLICVCMFIYLVIYSFRSKKLLYYYPILSLFIFSFIFSVATAYGRIEEGFTLSGSSRYLTFMIPLYFGLYLSFNLLMKKAEFRQSFLLVVLVLFIFSSDQNNYLNYQIANANKIADHNWKVCYLENKTEKYCEKKLNSLFYPWPERTHLQQKLQYLKKNKLNLFSG